MIHGSINGSDTKEGIYVLPWHRRQGEGLRRILKLHIPLFHCLDNFIHETSLLDPRWLQTWTRLLDIRRSEITDCCIPLSFITNLLKNTDFIYSYSHIFQRKRFEVNCGKIKCEKVSLREILQLCASFSVVTPGDAQTFKSSLKLIILVRCFISELTSVLLTGFSK